MPTVYFICYGNLCRSPFAHWYAEKQAAALGLSDLRFDSAGIGAMPGRPCPKPAVTAARELGVDLSAHLAKHTDDIAPGHDDWVIAMDRFVFGSVATRLGETLADTRGPSGSLLELMMQSLQGDPAHAGQLDVPDPMGSPLPVYRQCYALLVHATDQLLERLATR